MLILRMIIYALTAGLAGYGFGTYDAQSHVYTVQVDQLAEIFGGAAGFVGTYIVSRIAKRRGGKT